MIGPHWQKVINDLWDNKARTILVVLAIAAGVFAFGGVFMSKEVILGDMNAQYVAVNPASIDMSMSPFDEELVRAVEGMREVDKAMGRAGMSVKMLTPDGPINLILRAYNDYENMPLNQITPEEGGYPPRRREIILERASLGLSGAQIGDTVTIELQDGQERELVLSGTVHDLNAFPATMWPEMTGYVTFDTLKWLGHSGQYGQLFLSAGPEVTTRAETEEIANIVKERIERYGYQVGSIEAIRPGEHWSEEVTRGVILILGVLGGFTLALSAFLVINTITALLAQHQRQIGMLKVVGATGPKVIGLYMATVAAFGILSLVVALPMGMLLGWVTTVSVMNFLNLNILNFHMSFNVVAMMVAAALFAPMIAGLVPVMSGARVTVREALSDYGISSKVKQGWFDRFLADLRGLPRPLMLSLRNTFRRKARLALTLGTLTLAGAMFIAVLSVRQAMFDELDRALELWGYDVELSLNGTYPVRSLEREAMRVDNVVSMEGVTLSPAYHVRDDRSEGATLYVFGVSPVSLFTNGRSLMEEGRWLEPGDQNVIVVSGDVAKNNAIQVGDEITLKIGDIKRKWTVVGIVNTLGSEIAYVDYEYLTRVKGTPGQADRVWIETAQHDADTQDKAAEALEERLKRAGIGVGYTETGQTITESNTSQFNFIVAFLLGAAVILALVGGLGLAGTMSLNVLERTREIGVMRSVGAANSAVRGIVLAEGMVIGVISWVLGTAISAPICYLFGRALGAAIFGFPLAFTFSLTAVVLWLPVVLFISVVSSMLPARRAVRISVREALAYE
jgi:putative ABC transport system permease protein